MKSTVREERAMLKDGLRFSVVKEKYHRTNGLREGCLIASMRFADVERPNIPGRALTFIEGEHILRACISDTQPQSCGVDGVLCA